jgi:hypothetical protein
VTGFTAQSGSQRSVWLYFISVDLPVVQRQKQKQTFVA